MLDICRAVEVDPFADRVIVERTRVGELARLDVDRPAGEEVVAAAVVGVQMCVDDDVDTGEVEVLLAQWLKARIHIGHSRVQLRHAGVDQHTRIGMVDDVHVDRHPLALDVQVGNEDWRDGGGDATRQSFHGRTDARETSTAVVERQFSGAERPDRELTMPPIHA